VTAVGAVFDTGLAASQFGPQLEVEVANVNGVGVPVVKT
jgi:hypothetical protein